MNKSMYKSQLSKLEQQYNNYFNQHYVLNIREIEDLITYPTIKMIKSYISNYISSQSIVLNDYEDYFSDLDWNNFIDDFLNYMFYGWVSFEIIYEPGENGIMVEDIVLVPYRIIQKQNDILDNNEFRIQDDVILPYEKFLHKIYASPKPFGTSIMTKDFAKLVCEGRESQLNQAYYLYRLANPTLWAKLESGANERKVLKMLEKIRQGLSGITIGEQDEIGILHEGSAQGELFNQNIYNIDKKISNLMFFPYQLIDRMNTGSYNQSVSETKIFNKNVNSIITDLNDLLKQLCDKIGAVNNLNNKTLVKAEIPLISEDNEQITLDYLKEFVKPEDNQEFYDELTKSWLKKNIAYEYDNKLIFSNKSTLTPNMPSNEAFNEYDDSNDETN